MRLVADVPRPHVSVNVGGARGLHVAVRALITVAPTAKVTEVPGDGGLLGETASAVHALEPFTLVRVTPVPAHQALRLRRVVGQVVHAGPLAALIVT